MHKECRIGKKNKDGRKSIGKRRRNAAGRGPRSSPSRMPRAIQHATGRSDTGLNAEQIRRNINTILLDKTPFASLDTK